MLEAGNVAPLDRQSWGDYVTEHDQWALVGVPLVSVEYDGKTVIAARLLAAPLEKVDEPAMAGQKALNQFYARLQADPEGLVTDINGMSGGPIFALKKVDGIWKYTVIGVQSAWYPQSRIIAACPFTSFALALEVLVDKVLARECHQNSRRLPEPSQ